MGNPLDLLQEVVEHVVDTAADMAEKSMHLDSDESSSESADDDDDE